MNRQRDDHEPAGTSRGESVANHSPYPEYLSGADAKTRHTLRTPLNHIIGYSELLLEQARELGLEDMANDLHRIRAAGGELLSLIDRLMDPQAVESGAFPADESETPSLDQDPSDNGSLYPSDDGIRGAHLLIVDDNENNRNLVSRLLEHEGFRISSVENGAEALERVKIQPPDLILLDVMMPVMDGVEACRRLKDDPNTRLIPVIIMTALGQVEDRVRAIRAGADDFLTKPVNREELAARIQTSLRLKQTVDHKLDRLKGAQEYLARFVPQPVVRQLEQNPDCPEIEKTEQDVSALFVDVSGYTKLSESMRQTADFIVEKYFSRYLDAVHERGGDVTETSGDGLMVVFPAAEPAEHAINAASAAQDILRKTRDMNEQLDGIFEPISVHIGINSGIALIGPTKYEGASGVRWVYTALGPAINLAARIADVAEPGTICVGPETARRLKGCMTTAEVGRRRLKNISDEVTIYRIVDVDR